MSSHIEQTPCWPAQLGRQYDGRKGKVITYQWYTELAHGAYH